MLTIFSTPKDFLGEFNIIQTNALKSWRAIHEEIEIILIGGSFGVKAAAELINAKYIQEVEQSSQGTPTISGLFEINSPWTLNASAQPSMFCK